MKTATPAAQAKAAQARALQGRFDEIEALNHVDIVDAQRPMAPPPMPLDPTPILAARVTAARAKAPFFHFKARREALGEARELAAQDCKAAAAAAVEGMYRYQDQLDTWWASLRAGEQSTVLGALAAAFEDNEARAAAVGVHGTTASLVVVLPPVSDVPDRRPSTTASGNLSLKRLTKTETNQAYKTLVAGHVLLTVREALATAPSLSAVRIVAVRPGGLPGSPTQLIPLLAAGFTRAAVGGVDWHRTDPVHALTACSHDLLIAEKGTTRELQALNLADEPELSAALRAFALEVSDDRNPHDDGTHAR